MILKVITASINIIMNNKSVASSIQYSRLSEGASMIERMKEEADYYTRMEQLEKHQRENLNTVNKTSFRFTTSSIKKSKL